MNITTRCAWIGRMLLLVFLLAVSAGTSWGAEKVVRLMTTETDPNSVAALKGIIAEYQAAHRDVSIQPEFVAWSDIYKRLVATQAAGDPPDLVTIFEAQVSVLVDQGFLLPMNDVVEKIGKQDYFQNLLDSVTYKGKIWGVPSILTVDVLWYRKDLYEKNGLKVPKTWSELLHNIRTLHRPPDIYGNAIALATGLATDDFTVHSRIWSNGGTLFDKNGKVAVETDEVIEAMEYIRELAKYAPPGAASYGHLELINAYVARKVAHTQYGMRILTHIQRLAPDLLETTGAFLLPRGPRPGGRQVSHLWLKAWAVPKNAKQPEVAKDFIQFLETGDREVRWLHSVPIHNWPPRKSTTTSGAFLSHPLMKTPLGREAVNLVGEAISHGVFPTLETGVFNPKMPVVLEARILSKLAQRVVLGNTPPKEAVSLAAKELREVVAEK